MKKLSLDEIKAGALIGEPVPVSIKIMFNDEEAEVDTYIKPFNYETAVASLSAYAEKKESLAGIIASCVTDKKGKPVFTEQQVRQHFNQHLVEAAWQKIYEVNHPKKENKDDGDDAGKSKSSSAKMMKSGLSSLATESAGEPLRPPSEP